MTWGAFYMFYYCKKCNIKFKEELSDIGNDDFGHCPKCGNSAKFVADSGSDKSIRTNEYIQK